jgi:zinc protease
MFRGAIANGKRLKLSRILAVGCLGLALAICANAQAPAPPPPLQAAPVPTVDQILNHYLDAAGGRSAWQQLTSRVTTGTIDVPAANLSGTIELREKAPDRILSEIRIAGALFQQAFDGTVGWTDDPQNGLREQSGAELSEAKRDADFYHPLDLKKLYAKLSVVGPAKIDDRDTYEIEADVPEGNPDELYFDATTWLPVRVVSHRHTPQGVVDFREDFDDYREVDGIRRPFTIQETSGETALTIHITEVRHNVLLDDSVFTKPAAQ